MPGQLTKPLYVIDMPLHSTTTVLNEQTFSSTVNSATISTAAYRNFICTYKVGSIVSGSPTMVISLQVIDSAGNYINDPDYITTPISTATRGIAFKGFLEAGGSVRIICTYSGSGSMSAVTVALELKS